MRCIFVGFHYSINGPKMEKTATNCPLSLHKAGVNDTGPESRLTGFIQTTVTYSLCHNYDLSLHMCKKIPNNGHI